MGALSIWHWLIVLAVVLLLFGSKKLPEMARGLGRSARIFKSEIKEMQNDDKSEDPQEPQAITQGGQPEASQFAQPQAQQYAQPQQQQYTQPQQQAPQQYGQPQQPAPQQYGQSQGSPQGYPQAPQQPYQQPATQQPAPGQSAPQQQPGQPQQFSDPTAPFHGGQGQPGQ